MVALVLPDAAETADRVAVACEVLGRDRGPGEGGDSTSSGGEGLSDAEEEAESGDGIGAARDEFGRRRVLEEGFSQGPPRTARIVSVKYRLHQRRL